MAKRNAAESLYVVSIYDEPNRPGMLRFTFVPRCLPPTRVPGEPAKAVPLYSVTVEGKADETVFTWLVVPENEDVKGGLEDIAKKRVTARHQWLEKLRKLVDTVKGWSDELGWSTKVVEKKMEDYEIGTYKAPALLLQEEAVKLFLEPVSRVSPSAAGVVDLYLMPAYDDIASLYYYNHKWNVHYLFPGSPEVGNLQEMEAKPLTKATLRKVFDEMKRHASRSVQLDDAA